MILVLEGLTYRDKLAHMMDFGWDSMDAQMFSSLFVMVIVLALAIAIGISARRGLKNKTYLEKPKGFLFLAELYYRMCENFVKSRMGGKKWENWTGYFMTLFAYLFLAFIVSLIGLPSCIDWLWGPLSLSLIMFWIVPALYTSGG